MKELRLCRRCLKPHSFQRPCAHPVKCTAQDCERKHHPLLHNTKKDQTENDTATKEANTKAEEVAKVEGNYTHSTNDCSALFRYLPVTLRCGEKIKQIYAFLDEGSSTTLLSRKVANELGISGTIRPLCLSWSDGAVHREEADLEEITIEIQPNSKTQVMFKLRVRTTGLLRLPPQTLEYSALAYEYEHLRGLPIDSYQRAAPELLIGLDN